MSMFEWIFLAKEQAALKTYFFLKKNCIYNQQVYFLKNRDLIPMI